MSGAAVTMQVWRRAGYRRMPWANGGGITHEVAGSPPGSGLSDFDWRISVAEVATSGPFSTFAGVDRVIVLVEGAGMTLHVDGRPHQLAPHSPFVFDGAGETTCEVAGRTLDLNIMTRRGRAQAAVEVLPPATDHLVTAGGGELIVMTLAGNVCVAAPGGEEIALGALDGLRWTGSSPIAVSGGGTVAVVRITGTTHQRGCSDSGSRGDASWPRRCVRSPSAR